MEAVKEGKEYSFPEEEQQVLQLWDNIDAFQEQLRRSKGKPAYVFYDGPPFATGLPHYGHLLAGTLKVISPLSSPLMPSCQHLPSDRVAMAYFISCFGILLTTSTRFNAGCCHEICHSNRPLLPQTIWVSPEACMKAHATSAIAGHVRTQI